MKYLIALLAVFAVCFMVTPKASAITTEEAYAQFCQGCHGPLATSSVKGKTADQIINAVNTVPEMASLKTYVTQDLATALAQALGAPQANNCHTVLATVHGTLGVSSPYVNVVAGGQTVPIGVTFTIRVSDSTVLIVFADALSANAACATTPSGLARFENNVLRFTVNAIELGSDLYSCELHWTGTNELAFAVDSCTKI